MKCKRGREREKNEGKKERGLIEKKKKWKDENIMPWRQNILANNS